MQRLNAQGDARFLRVGKDLEQAVQHGGSRVLESLSIGRAGADHQYRCAEQGGPLKGTTFIFNALAPSLGGGCRDQTATAQAGDTQAFPADHRRCLRCIAAEFMAPHADVWDVARGAIADGLLERPRIGCHLIEAEALQQTHATPASNRKLRIRCIASSELRNTPAWSARTNSSHKWAVDRALSSPRTMRTVD